MDPADVVLRFLESVGRRSEAEFYVNLFRAEPKEQFAAIAVDADVAGAASEAVVLALRFLAALSLTPVVLLGHLEPQEARPQAGRLHQRLTGAGVAARLVTAPDVSALAEQCASCTQAGVLPIVALGPAEGATLEERFEEIGGLLAALKTRKLVFLHRPGGLRRDGALLPLVNLSTGFTGLERSEELSPKERVMVVQSRRLIFDLVAHRLTVSITSPLNVQRELFTVKGAGTLLRRGAVIERKRSFAEADLPRLKALLSSSFGRAPLDGFFGRAVDRLYLEEAYRGAAILEATPHGAYLTKFAVEREAQGEGIARDLWDALAAEHPVVFWRARPENPINEWYGKLADGLHRLPNWVVFWKGVAVDQVPNAIAFALGRPADLPDTESAAAPTLASSTAEP